MPSSLDGRLGPYESEKEYAGFNSQVFEKKDIAYLRSAAALWLAKNSDHPEAENVRRSIANTNIPSMGRPRVPESKRQQVIEMMRKPKAKYSPIARRLGISPPTVKRIWDEYLVAEALRMTETKKKYT